MPPIDGLTVLCTFLLPGLSPRFFLSEYLITTGIMIKQRRKAVTQDASKMAMLTILGRIYGLLGGLLMRQDCERRQKKVKEHNSFLNVQTRLYHHRQAKDHDEQQEGIVGAFESSLESKIK